MAIKTSAAAFKMEIKSGIHSKTHYRYKTLLAAGDQSQVDSPLHLCLVHVEQQQLGRRRFCSGDDKQGRYFGKDLLRRRNRHRPPAGCCHFLVPSWPTGLPNHAR
jgi:hypothetical protein